MGPKSNQKCLLKRQAEGDGGRRGHRDTTQRRPCGARAQAQEPGATAGRGRTDPAPAPHPGGVQPCNTLMLDLWPPDCLSHLAYGALLQQLQETNMVSTLGATQCVTSASMDPVQHVNTRPGDLVFPPDDVSLTQGLLALPVNQTGTLSSSQVPSRPAHLQILD